MQKSVGLLLLAWPVAVWAFAPQMVAAPGARHLRAATVSRIPGRAVLPAVRGRTRLSRRGAVALRAEADPLEGRKFKIGDPVEAQWIGDDAMYPGTIEGYFTEGRYDVKWADPQGMADAQPTQEENIIPFEAAKYYRYGLGCWENGDVSTAYLCMRTVYICVGAFAKTQQHLEKLMEEPEVKELMAQILPKKYPLL